MGKRKSAAISDVRIAVVGPGAIGTVFAVFLAKAGHNVTLVDYRPARAKRLSRHPLVVQCGRRRITAKVAVTSRPRGKFDLAILAVKAYSLAGAAKKMKAWVGSAPVLAIQNGLGIDEVLAQFLPNSPIALGVTFQAANTIKEGVVKQVANLPTYIGYAGGATDERLHSIVATLRTADLPACEEVDILPIIWGKALVNSAINPVCALAKVRNGELLKSKPLADLAEAICREGHYVARASGIDLPYRSAYTVVQRTCEETSANRCSMLQDLEAGRKTEIDFLNGALCQKAAEHGLAVPVNWTLVQVLRLLEGKT